MTIKQFLKSYKKADKVLFAVQVNDYSTFYTELKDKDFKDFISYLENGNHAKKDMLATLAPNNVMYVGE